MRVILIALVVIIAICSCKSGHKKAFCADPCLKDTLKFTIENPLQPYVYITAKNCKPDSVIWSYSGMGVNKKSGFFDLLNKDITLDKNLVRCYIRDTAYAWLLFNDCGTGRGFQLKLPFNRRNSIGIMSSGINNIDPKFYLDEGLLANSDRGNIYVEEMSTGKKAMMTFGKAAEIDYDDIHNTLDSVHITSDRIWVKVKIDGKWKELEKKIKLE